MGWGFGTFKECANAWFNEYQAYINVDGLNPLKYVGNGDPLMQRYNLSITNGHFTAMVNAQTDRLGCGVLRDPELDTVYVCNYYPAGNIFTRQRSSNAMMFLPAYQIVGDSEKILTTK